ncbi:MAG: hypothetical protein ACI4HO_08735 [Ruminococcus sp.]
MRNPAYVDARKVLTGKDGALFNSEGTMLATVETYQAQVNISNAKFQPLGDMQEHEIPQSYGVTLTFTEIVISDAAFIKELVEAMKPGNQMPSWTFQGVIHGRDNTQERVVYYDCVPSGTIDLQNLSVGDIVKRQWSLFVNTPPEMTHLLGVSAR